MKLTIETEKQGNILYLNQTFLTGEVNDYEVIMGVGAGCGNSKVLLEIKKGDFIIREVFDAGELLEQWALAKIAEIEAEVKKELAT